MLNKSQVAKWKEDTTEWCPCCKSRKKARDRYLCEECQEWYDKQVKLSLDWDNFLASGGQ